MRFPLASIAKEADFDRFGLICDIEGGEFDLLEHELDFLCAHVPWLMMELHGFTPRGEAGIQEALDLLIARGYTVLSQVDTCCCLSKHIS